MCGKELILRLSAFSTNNTDTRKIADEIGNIIDEIMTNMHCKRVELTLPLPNNPLPHNPDSENNIEKRENAGNPHYLLYPTMFFLSSEQYFLKQYS